MHCIHPECSCAGTEHEGIDDYYDYSADELYGERDNNR